MKGTWVNKNLGDLVEVLDKLRKPITRKDRLEGEYPYYGATGILSYVHNYLFSERLVLIGEDGAKWNSGDATSFIAEGKYWVNNHAHVVRPDRSVVIDEWIVHYLNYSDLMPYISGMTVPKLNQERMRSIPIPLPPLPEQKRIVAILDECFAAIAKAKANAEQNLKNAKELFESYLQGVFEKRGEGWEEKTLGEICEFIRGPFGGSLKKDIFELDGFAVYEQRHAIYNQYEDIRYFINKEKFTEMQRFELKPGDLIMSCSGTMGKVSIVPQKIREGIINQALLKICTGKKILNTYLKLWMESKSFQNSLKKYSGGAAIQNVASVSILKGIKISLPTIEEQHSIVRKLDALRAETTKLETIYRKKIEDLEELKKSILQRAFEGEL